MAKKINATVTPGKTPESIVVQQIVIRPPVRKSSTVTDWSTALQSANLGKVKLLFDLYTDYVVDGILADAMSKRMDAITNSPLTFQNAEGEEVPEIVALIDSPAWEDLLTEIMQVRFWGRAGVELGFSNGANGTELSVWPIPKKHINLTDQIILLNETDSTGISYADDDSLLIMGRERDFGLLLKTAPFAIYKRGGFGDYAQWLEIFGMPQRVGKYSSYDPEGRKLLEQAMELSGSAPWIVVPKESDIETTQNTGNGGSGTAYNEFRDACNEEILITILGQTMTTIQGEKGARSLGEVHKAVEEGKNRSDMRFVQRVLNYLLLPILEKRGFPVKGGKFVFPQSAEELTVAELVELSSIIEIPSAWIHEKYSIPMAEEGEAVAGKKTEPVPTEPTDPTDPPVKTQGIASKKDVKLSDDDKNWLEKLLGGFFVAAPTKTIGANLKDRWTNFIKSINLADEVNTGIDVDKLFNQAMERIYKQQGHKMPLVDKRLFDISNTAFQLGIDLSFKKAGASFGKTYPEFMAEFKANAAVFAAFKAHSQTNAVVNLLSNDAGDLRSFSEFKKLALNVSKDYNKNWLKTEYNTAVRAARMAAKVKGFEKVKHLYPNMEYMLSTAAIPREDHLTYVGTILPIGHPWWSKHLPPSEWGCECSVKQTDKPVTKVPDGDTQLDILFDNNPAETAQIINVKEHPYVKSVTDPETEKAIKELAAKMFKG